MPTRDRRPYAPLALACFLKQTHVDKELLVLDDGDDPIKDLLPQLPNVLYFASPPPPKTLGTKLNELAKLAHGDICVNWDDDDWSHPERIAQQLAHLTASGLACTGFHQHFYWDLTTSTAMHWKWNRKEPYCAGSSQMYTKAWALAHPLENKTACVDYGFVYEANKHRQLSTTSGDHLFVARWTPHSTWRAHPLKCGYPPAPRDALPPLFFADRGDEPRGPNPHPIP
jgi:glycosyltransferase involved in cell wall biosynthesis